VADGILLARKGVRAVAIITEPFQATAQAMARRMGVDQPAWVVAPHPVSSLSPDAVRRLARELAPRVRRLLEGSEERSGTADPTGAKEEER